MRYPLNSRVDAGKRGTCLAKQPHLPTNDWCSGGGDFPMPRHLDAREHQI